MGAIHALHRVTALNLANIPSHINTYERLMVWCSQALQNIANGQEVNVQQNADPQQIASCSLVTTTDGVYRAMCIAYIPVDQSELNSPTEKTWMAAQDLGTAAPHVSFLAN